MRRIFLFVLLAVSACKTDEQTTTRRGSQPTLATIASVSTGTADAGSHANPNGVSTADGSIGTGGPSGGAYAPAAGGGGPVSWIGDDRFGAGSDERVPPTDVAAKAGPGTPLAPPAEILTVDWGSTVRLRWNVQDGQSAELVWVHLATSSTKHYPAALPQGSATIDTHELQAGGYIVSLVVQYGKSGFRELPLYVQLLPVLKLAAADTSQRGSIGVDYPVLVTVAAGADRVRLFLNSAAEAAVTLDAVEAGTRPTAIKPLRNGDQNLQGFAWRFGLQSRPAQLAFAVGDDVDTGDCPKGKGGASTDGMGQADKGAPASTLPDDCETPVQQPQPPPPPPVEASIAAHLINSFPGSCRMLEIRGDASDTAVVSGVDCKGPSNLQAVHDWYAARTFGLPAATVLGAIKANHRGSPLPLDVSGDQIADFPMLDFNALTTKVAGTLKASAVPWSSWHPDLSPAENVVAVVRRNLVVVGSKLAPIMIHGDVLVVGDLVLKGWVQGTGTIYVTGNVFLPSDVFNVTSAYPFPVDRAGADAQALTKLGKTSADGFGIVAQGFIVAGDNYPLYGDPTLNPQVQAMYGWFADGKKGYKRLYEPPYDCQSNSFPLYTKAKYDECDCHINGGFSLIEASLYAKAGIYGSSGAWLNPTTYVPNSFAINGTVISSAFNIVTTPDLCATPTAPHPVHKYPQGRSYLNLDWRLGHGLKVFTQLKPFYEQP